MTSEIVHNNYDNRKDVIAYLCIENKKWRKIALYTKRTRYRNEMQSCDLLRTQSIVIGVSEALSLLDGTVTFYGVFRKSVPGGTVKSPPYIRKNRLHELIQYNYMGLTI